MILQIELLIEHGFLELSEVEASKDLLGKIHNTGIRHIDERFRSSLADLSPVIPVSEINDEEKISGSVSRRVLVEKITLWGTVANVAFKTLVNIGTLFMFISQTWKIFKAGAAFLEPVMHYGLMLIKPSLAFLISLLPASVLNAFSVFLGYFAIAAVAVPLVMIGIFGMLAFVEIANAVYNASQQKSSDASFIGRLYNELTQGERMIKLAMYVPLMVSAVLAQLALISAITLSQLTVGILAFVFIAKTMSLHYEIQGLKRLRDLSQQEGGRFHGDQEYIGMMNAKIEKLINKKRAMKKVSFGFTAVLVFSVTSVFIPPATPLLLSLTLAAVAVALFVGIILGGVALHKLMFHKAPKPPVSRPAPAPAPITTQDPGVFNTEGEKCDEKVPRAPDLKSQENPQDKDERVSKQSVPRLALTPTQDPGVLSIDDLEDDGMGPPKASDLKSPEDSQHENKEDEDQSAKEGKLKATFRRARRNFKK